MSSVDHDADLDVVVIGGGINGTGAARDLALRGLRVALVEKRDIGSGATCGSSGMIHGGARYLTHEPKVTKLSCVDSGAVRRIAPHMLFRIPFVAAFPSHFRQGPVGARLGLHLLDSLLFAYDLYQPLKGGLPHRVLGRDEALELEPGLSPGIVGAVTWDEWGIDSARLCVANAISAHEAGAHVHVRSEVRSFLRDEEGRVRGVVVRDRARGGERTLRSKAVLNASGPWSEMVAGLGGATVRMRPAKGVHLVLGGVACRYAIAATAIDGRFVYLEPWHDVTLVGTTDDDYYGNLDDVEVTFDEVQYLLEALETVFPSIRQHRVIDTWAAVRPTLRQYGPIEDRLSREHQVFDHRREGAEGLFSLAGGKLASYRVMAEEAADAICDYLGHDAPCRTALEPLPGGEGEIAVEAWAGANGVPEHVLHRMAQRHGSRVPAVLSARVGSRAALGAVCRCEQVLEAELRHCVRSEWAHTLGDLMRRTRLGTGPCGGVGCAMRAAQVLAEELGRDPAWAMREAQRFLEQRFRARRPAALGHEARHEALLAHRLALVGPGGVP